MDPLSISLLSFSFILAGALGGFFFGTILPEHHVVDESKDAVKMGWGIIATMSALVLSLLVASAKNTFDSVNSQCTQKAAQVIVLNHALVQYGPEANEVRAKLRTVVAASIRRDWPDAPIQSDVPAAPQFSNPLEAFHDEIDRLTPTTDRQRILFCPGGKSQKRAFDGAMAHYRTE